MATRTLRLDDETEKILDRLIRATGLSIGPGGYSIAPSTDVG